MYYTGHFISAHAHSRLSCPAERILCICSCDPKFTVEWNKLFQIKLSKILNVQFFHFDSKLE